MPSLAETQSRPGAVARSQAAFRAFAAGCALVLASVLSCWAGWTIQRPEGNPPYGYYPSITLDASGFPHIAYQDRLAPRELRYVRWNGSAWVGQTVDTGLEADSDGHTSLVLDSNGLPRISYRMTTGGVPQLKYAAWNGISWSTTTVDSGTGINYTSIGRSSNNHIHICYNIGNLVKHAWWNGVAWSTRTVDGSAATQANYPSIKAVGASAVHLAYSYGVASGELKYGLWNGVSWSTSTVDVVATQYTSLAMSGSNPVVAYRTDSFLKYAVKSGLVWSTETAVDIPADVGQAGKNCSLALTSGGDIRIAYNSVADGDLRLARRAAAGGAGNPWDVKLLDAGQGSFPSIAVDGVGMFHIAYGSLYFQYMAENSSPDAPSAPSVTGRTTTSFQWAWFDNAEGESGYQVRRSTDGAAIQSLPAGTSSWLQTGLGPNTPQDLYVEAVGVATSAASGSQYTLANPPTGTAFQSVAGDGIAISWSANGNPSYTNYRIHLSTDNLTFLPTYTAAGATSRFMPESTFLAQGVTYYFRVQAQNGNAQATAFDITVSTRMPFGPPSVPLPAYGGSSTGTILWNWNNTSTAETGYRVRHATSNAVLADLPANTTFWIQAGLTPNVLQEVRLEAYNTYGSSSSASVLGATLPIEPSAPSFGMVGATGVTVSWDANGNPPLTDYSVWSSTDDISYQEVAYVSATTSSFVGGLVPATTYFFGIVAVGAAGNSYPGPSASVVTLAVSTPPAAPSGLSGAVLGVSSISWTWSDMSSDEAGFRVRDPANNADLSGALSAGATSWVQTGLVPNVGYQVVVEAFNVGGSSASAPSAAVFTLLPPSAPSGVSGTAVGSSSISWTWSDAASNETGYRVRRSSDNADLSGILPAGTTSWLQGGLAPNVAYQVSVEAFNLAGSSASAPSGPVATQFIFSQAVSASGGVFALNLAGRSVTLDVSSGAFPSGAVLEVRQAASFPPPESPVLRLGPTGAGLEIFAAGGEQPLRPVSVTVGYQPAEVAGMNEGRLALLRHDPQRGLWVLLPSTVDPLADRVTARTDHFSLFQIMQLAPADNVSAARAFPNPLRPALAGHDRMTFSNMPAGAVLKVYTLAGELVRELTADAVGMAPWDGRNQSGQDVASGVYLVFVEGVGGDFTMKVMVQR